MRVRGVGHGTDEKVELQMTPMIDVVFQLLTFFIFSLKIIAPEGDFNIKMPLTALQPGPPDDKQLPPMKVRLKAGRGGQLADIQFGQRSLGTSFKALREQVRQVIGDDPGPGTLEDTEVELDCDYDLRYEYVVRAITAVSGYVDPQTGLIKKIVEKIKFAPPHR